MSSVAVTTARTERRPSQRGKCEGRPENSFDRSERSLMTRVRHTARPSKAEKWRTKRNRARLVVSLYTPDPLRLELTVPEANVADGAGASEG
jgi:hypothetical protein